MQRSIVSKNYEINCDERDHHLSLTANGNMEQAGWLNGGQTTVITQHIKVKNTITISVKLLNMQLCMHIHNQQPINCKLSWQHMQLYSL